MNNLRAMGPGPNVSATQHTQRLDNMAQELKRREEEVKREQNLYTLEAAKKSALEKVALALQKGLAETALTALDPAAIGALSGPKEFGVVRDVMIMLLKLGRLDEARKLLIPEGEEMTGKPVSPDYLELHLLLAAGRGDYELADRLLADALNYTWKNPAGQPLHFAQRVQVGLMIGSVLMSGAGHVLDRPRVFLPPLRMPIPSDYVLRHTCLEALEGALAINQPRTEWQLLRGWLAVESGRCVEARDYFQNALDTMALPQRWMPAVGRLKLPLGPEDFQLIQGLAARQSIAQSFSRQYLKWLEFPNK
jgi:hypothetical protein